MALDTAQLNIGGSGNVYVAPVGTTAPVDVTTAWAGTWVELGYLEEGPTFTDSKEVVDINGWQSRYPLEKLVNTRDHSVSFALMQWNDDNFKVAFGGGTVSALGGGVFKYAPPAADFLDYRAFGIEIRDGSDTSRFIMPKGLVTENVEMTATRTTAMQLPVTVSVVTTGSGDPWYWITNMASMNPA